MPALQLVNELGLELYNPHSPSFGPPMLSPDLRMSANISAWAGQIFPSFWDTKEAVSLVGPSDPSYDNQLCNVGSEMYTRISWGKPGYIFSHLMSIDPRLKTLESSATLVEQIIKISSVSYRNLRENVQLAQFSKEPQKLLDQSFSIMAYLVSNNFFQESEIDALVRWAIKGGLGDQLGIFLHTNSDHIRSCAAKILSICPHFEHVATLSTRNLLDLGRPLGAAHGRGFRNLRKLDLLKQAIDHDNLEQADLLVSNGVSLNQSLAVWAPWKDSLSYTVHRGSLKMVELLMRAGADFYFALEVAIDGGRVAMADILLKQEGKCNDGFLSRVHHRLEHMKSSRPNMYRVLRGRNPKGFQVFEMFQAAEKGNTALSKFIVEQDINEDDLEDGLCEGVKCRDKKVVRAFLLRGVNPNTRSRLMMRYGGKIGDVKWHCLIQLAMKIDKGGSSLVYVHLLLNAGADMNNEYLLDLCRLSIDKNQPDFMLLLVQKGYDMALIGPSVLEYMAGENRIYVCELLLIAGAPVNKHGVEGMSALQAAAREGNSKLMEYLVDQGAEVNLPASDYGGKTALQAAASQGENYAVEWLIKAGANINAAPAIHNGMTLLEAAAHGIRYCEVGSLFKKLLAFGAPVNRPDGASGILLQKLIRSGDIGCLRLALEAGARMEDREASGSSWTPLQMAARRRNREAILLLLSHGADINAHAGDDHGSTAVQAAVQSADIETVRLLARHGAVINAPAGKEYGRTALQAATSSDVLDPGIVSFLLDHGADVNAMPSKKGGITTLQGAAIRGDIQIARILLNKGADVNAAPALEEGRTAVEGAAEHGRMDMVRLLINAGAKPDPINGFAKAIELADENNHSIIGDLLERVEESFLSTEWSDSLTPWPLSPGGMGHG
ncbi:ankyrin repeat-containing domain protein [Dactylonectria estremocensis]|uniref:Ankyrin repeat-containing domain protein n=1 Tax=Dactylonectria estremocensis TaxID=1079267 RepID=A0A9P9ECJ1_9HYPO|nr:ankyrin repeat-containing domain protein [Dactylonectria estremocensis]